MRSLLLDCTHGRAWHDITAIGQHTIGRRLAWHDITALGQHTRSDYVRHGITSLPLYSTLGRTTSSVACHYRLWAAHTIERRRAGHARIAHGRQTRSNNVWRDMPSCLWEAHTVERRRAWYDFTAFGHHTESNVVGRDMPSSPLDSTHGQTKSGVACHHSP